MTKVELLTFLDSKTWTPPMQKQLVDVWNELRGDSLGKINTSAVRTSCRLKDVVSSLRKYANENM